MDKAELLATFNDRINQFEKYQGFIVKAREQAGKFASAVVEKVVADNSTRCTDLVAEIQPLLNDLEQVLEDLQSNREGALDSAKESQFRLEELELRLAIGDLSEANFRSEASDYKAVVESTDTRVAEIDAERAQFADALDRWSQLGADAGLDGGSNHDHDDAIDLGHDQHDDHQYVTHDAGHGHSGHGHGHSGQSGGMMIEALEADDDQDAFIPAHDADDVLAEPVDLDDAVDLHMDNGVGDAFEVDGLNLVPEDDDAGYDDALDKEDKPRRSVLLYQEGTAEEQIYPFTGEIMSLGRGRDNDVQVKNDSKVSRYHCKLYRRGPNFYIEDNKSANGTLVNGELITERRLFGGEEVIIGETFFRFRILD
jgi:hypothetical protein